jgi:hypothetical protein
MKTENQNKSFEIEEENLYDLFQNNLDLFEELFI